MAGRPQPTVVADASLRATFPLRPGGSIEVTDDAVLIDRDVWRGPDNVRILPDQVTEIALESIDWFLVVMSVVLVGFGVFSIDRSLVGGLAFVAFGIANLYYTYRKRGALQIRTADRRKPVTVHPVDPQAVYDALEPVLGE